MRLVGGLIFIGVVGTLLWLLFEWRDARVEQVVENVDPGDVVEVGTDVCEVLKDRDLIAAATDCGYRDSIKVWIKRPN